MGANRGILDVNNITVGSIKLLWVHQRFFSYVLDLHSLINHPKKKIKIKLSPKFRTSCQV